MPRSSDHRFEDDAVAEAFELEQCAATVLGVVAGDEVVATKIGSWCGWFAAPALEPAYSARDAAARLGRSYSWPDQRLRGDKFVLPDGTKVEPRRTAGGYRRFTLAMREDIA